MSVPNRPTITRRRALALAGGAAASGLGAVALGSREADAEVSMSELAIADGTHAADDPAPTPVVEVDARMAWTVDAISTYNVSLEVGTDHDSREFVDLVSESTSVTDGEAEASLSGAVTDVAGFTASEFAPAAGETYTTDVAVALVFSVMHDGANVTGDTIEDTASITVENTAAEISVELGGDGQVTFEE
jgi:hypothetical protein